MDKIHIIQVDPEELLAEMRKLVKEEIAILQKEPVNELLGRKELAELLGISIDTLRRRLREKHITGIATGRKTLFEKDVVLQRLSM